MDTQVEIDTQVDRHTGRDRQVDCLGRFTNTGTDTVEIHTQATKQITTTLTERERAD